MKLITTILDDPRLLPQFLEHYRKLGVTQFFVGVRASLDWPYRTFDGATLSTIDEAYTSDGDAEVSNRIARANIKEGEPFMVADLDEFYDLPVPHILRFLDTHDAVSTRMVDCTTFDGSLPELDPTTPLAQQFPRLSRLTAGLCGGETKKIIALKGGMEVLSGHHSLKDAGRFKEIERGHLFHYKWHRGVLKRMLDRYELHVRLSKPWKDEPRKVLEAFIDHGRMPVEKYPFL